MRILLAVLLLSFLVPMALPAQSSSGTITGRVLDSSGQTVPGAVVTLTKQDTREGRTFTTPASGDFVFASLQPGPYSLRVEGTGFKTLEKTDLELTASDRLSAGDLVLQVGAVAEVVKVTAQATPVQTTSSERSAVIDSNQVANLTTRGRDVFGLLVTLPGVIYDGRGQDGLGTQASPAAFSGARGIYSAANVDGISGNTRSGASLDTPVNMDNVAEVKVLLNNYQAEYGKGAAGVINVVTKGGTQDFHGLAYYYVRNEAFNANTFFSNKAGVERGRYRFNTVGGNFGGPIYIPGHFNTKKNKLFFFFAQEYQPTTEPQDPRYYTVPTARERSGDFTQSVGASSGALYAASKIIDPLSGLPFPNGTIPAARIDPNMQKLLNVFPLPNAPNAINGGAISPAGAWYNYTIHDYLLRPGRQNSLRVDYNINDKWRAFFRGTNEGTHNKGSNSTVNRYAWMPDADVDYALTGPNLGGTLTWIASPTLVNEIIFGYGLWTESQLYRDAWLAEVSRDKLGVNLPQIYPAQNPLNLIPSMTFGGTNIGPNAATTAWEGRFPMADEADTWTLTDNLTKVWRNHQFKTGVQYERVHYLFEQSGPNDVFAGKFDFSQNSANTLTNTTYPYANALLGYFNTYTESTNRTQYSPVTPILEFYVQDSWKVKPHLTLDLGVRFTVGLQQYQSNNLASTLVPSLFDPTKAPILYRPALKGSTRMAIDPRNPTVFLPVALVGQIIPGTGDLRNGIVQAGDPGYPRALVDFQGIQPAPRLGFAWDVFGDGRTAVRGGFGINFNPRNGSGITGDLQSNPPIVYQPSELYGTTATYRNITGTFTPPTFADSINRSNPPARVYNASLGIQRRLAFGMVLDVAYVGTFGRHIGEKSQLNNLPFGTRFLPSSLDATQKLPQALPDDFLRPYQGYSTIPFLNFEGNSSYHSLQTSLQRRLARGFQLGAVYTWSKAMTYSDSDQGAVSTFVSRRQFDYGEATYDRTHVFAVNYLWSIPSGYLKNGLLKRVAGGWQISGITRVQSGQPLSLSTSLKTGCSLPAPAPCAAVTTNNFGTDITGGGDAWRAVMAGNPVLSSDARGIDQWFNTSVFSPPALAQQVTNLAGVLQVLAKGNTPKTFARGPGIANTDIALFKNFKVYERLNSQLRFEAYNVLNKTQFSTVGTTAQWDQSGAQVNTTFGKVTAARDPRILQLAIRIQF